MKSPSAFLAMGLAAGLLQGCGPAQEPTKVGFDDNKRPTLMAGDKSKVLVPHPVLDDAPREATDKPVEKKPVLEKPAPPSKDFKAGKVDPAVFGDYRIEVNDETKRLLDNGIRKLREQGANGDAQAATALEYSEAAQKAAEEMSIQLRDDGKFFADFVSGKTFGKYEMSGETLRLLPNEVLTESGAPKSFELTFDKSNRKLTLHLEGSTLTFAKFKRQRTS